jgi:hypothetical protein
MGGDAGAHGAGAENGNFVNTLHECDSCNKKILLLDCGENSPRFLKLHSLDFVILSEAKGSASRGEPQILRFAQDDNSLSG